jgi:hypothetical protein
LSGGFDIALLQLKAGFQYGQTLLRYNAFAVAEAHIPCRQRDFIEI